MVISKTFEIAKIFFHHSKYLEKKPRKPHLAFSNAALNHRSNENASPSTEKNTYDNKNYLFISQNIINNKTHVNLNINSLASYSLSNFHKEQSE